MKVYRFLFHVHTYRSFDASISYMDLVKTIKKFSITHIAITEHNNMDSYFEFKEILKRSQSEITLIPSIEYSTEVGDLIVLNYGKLIQFDNYNDLLAKVKKIKKSNPDVFIVLPHPGKRKSYPDLLIRNIDFYELLNMREFWRSFDGSRFKNIRFLYGSDAHVPFELPGIINVIFTEKDFFEALKSEVIIPEIHNPLLKLHCLSAKLRSKIKRKLKL